MQEREILIAQFKDGKGYNKLELSSDNSMNPDQLIQFDGPSLIKLNAIN